MPSITDFFSKGVLNQRGPEIHLANRKYLAGSDGVGFPATMEYAGSDDCDLYTLTGNITVEQLGLSLRLLVNTSLRDKGAMLVKGLDKVITGNKELSQLAEVLGEKFTYTAGMATRTEFEDAPGVVAASDDPPEVTMEPHLEMSYNREMPGKILFYCNSPSSCEGGQTPICDMRRVYRDLAEYTSLLRPLMDNGVRYSRFLPSARSNLQPLYNWQKTFFTEDKEVVGSVLSGLGYEYEWIEGDMLHYWWVMVSLRRHPDTGEMIWSNQSSVNHGSYYTHLPGAELLGYTDQETTPSHTSHHDGSPLTKSQLEVIRNCQWRHCKAIQWNRGDLLILDNNAVAHGRVGFKPNSGRNIVVSLLK